MIGQLASSVGRGLFAGAAGTAVMTAAQWVEMKVTKRTPSKVPAEAAKKMLGIEPKSERSEERLANVVHFAYGTAWGAVRGLLSGAGVASPVATLAHFGLVWGAEVAMLPALGLAPPATQWPKKQIATDLTFHGVYVLTTALAYQWLDRKIRR